MCQHIKYSFIVLPKWGFICKEVVFEEYKGRVLLTTMYRVWKRIFAGEIIMSLIKNNSIFQYIAVLLIIAMSGAHVILGLYVPINLLLIMFLAYSFFSISIKKEK